MNETLYRAHLVFELFRSIGEEECSTQLSSVFLWIAANEGCYQEEIAENLNLAKSSVSRNLSRLGSTHSSGKAGLNLVKQIKTTGRYRCLLTAKGKQFASMIEKQLSGPLFLVLDRPSTLRTVT